MEGEDEERDENEDERRDEEISITASLVMPSRRSCLAMARPMPLAAPVTNATCSGVKSGIFIFRVLNFLFAS